MDTAEQSPARSNHKRKRHAQDQPRRAINPVKKRRRDLERLLNHSQNIPPGVRIGYERELVSCNVDLEAAQKEARRSHMIRKYHMVRFFERKKATRALKKAQKALDEAVPTENLDDLKAQVHFAQVDLNYTLYYPLELAYASLFAVKKDQGEEAIVRTHPMWKVVESAMGEDKLEDLRDGKYPIQDSEATGIPSKAENAEESVERPLAFAAAGHRSNHARKKPERGKDLNAQEKEGGSDREDGGGFFEP